MDKTIINRIESFFENYPSENSCFIASDGMLFPGTGRSYASDHAESLKKKDILHVTRGTNLEDWYDDVFDTPEMEVIKPGKKWGWFNWLYKILS